MGKIKELSSLIDEYDEVKDRDLLISQVCQLFEPKPDENKKKGKATRIYSVDKEKLAEAIKAVEELNEPDESRLIDTRIIPIDPHPKAPFIDITDLLKAQRDLTAFIKDTECQAGEA